MPKATPANAADAAVPTRSREQECGCGVHSLRSSLVLLLAAEPVPALDVELPPEQFVLNAEQKFSRTLLVAPLKRALSLDCEREKPSDKREIAKINAFQ